MTYTYEEITAAEVQRRLEAGEQLTLIDIREPFEWQMTGVIPGARLVSMRPFLLQHLDGLPKDQEVILVCASGIRTADAAVYMGMKGFSGAKSMAGGMHAWKGQRVQP
ncbi:MAG TPA: rhodanese-like domain-containing protein [Symbiobacteriaceae bacterium]|nr:rhodanese-like domain-containing protein [Symbiobacteriaceae bacterium]